MQSEYLRDGEHFNIYKDDDNDILYHVEIIDENGFDVTPKGPFLFSFDGETVYNFWSDWDSFTDEQKKIFREANPTMAALKE